MFSKIEIDPERKKNIIHVLKWSFNITSDSYPFFLL